MYGTKPYEPYRKQKVKQTKEDELRKKWFEYIPYDREVVDAKRIPKEISKPVDNYAPEIMLHSIEDKAQQQSAAKSNVVGLVFYKVWKALNQKVKQLVRLFTKRNDHE